MAKFFVTPFAASASKSTIPDNDTTVVSWNGGYTVNYEYNPLTNTRAKHIERDKMNTLFYEITSSIQQIQLYGCAPYYEAVIATSGPGYPEGAFVSYGGKVWRSKLSGNRVIPNANSTKNWEIVYGYDSLVSKLKEDGLTGGSSGSGNGYSKTEIDNKLIDLSDSMISLLGDYTEKTLGEIYLLTWCDEDRNDNGYFLCNGDTLPYVPADEEDDGSNPLTFYGNKLYDLCFDYAENGNSEVETDFMKRWNVKVNKTAKTIQLPNILGLRSTGTVASETDHMLLALGKESGTPVLTGSNAFTTDTKNNAYFFKMLPCIYLGNKTEE